MKCKLDLGTLFPQFKILVEFFFPNTKYPYLPIMVANMLDLSRSSKIMAYPTLQRLPIPRNKKALPNVVTDTSLKLVFPFSILPTYRFVFDPMPFKRQSTLLIVFLPKLLIPNILLIIYMVDLLPTLNSSHLVAYATFDYVPTQLPSFNLDPLNSFFGPLLFQVNIKIL